MNINNINNKRTNQSFGLFQWQKEAGLWPSYIHINFVGDVIRTMMRNDAAILDENMFVTAWILEILLEVRNILIFNSMFDLKINFIYY